MNDVQAIDTLDWQGDELSFISDVEQIFAIDLPSKVDWVTLGDVLEQVDAHIRAHGDGDGCATQMVFYRLRRALGLPASARPSDELVRTAFEPMKARLSEIEASIGLPMPEPDRQARYWIGLLLCLASLCSGALPVSALTKFTCFVLTFASGAMLMRLDRGKLPRDWRTLGDLTRAIADRNRGALARQGARLRREEIWRIIQELAALESGIDPGRIGTGTTFFMEKRKAA